MEIFKHMSDDNYEQVIFCYDAETGLEAIIVIHDTTLGPALGGARMWPYASEEEAFIDALRLAKGMTYKNAAAGVDLGGGKTVIIGDPRKDKTEKMLRRLGQFINDLNGTYITAEDVGTTVEDMDTIQLETDHVVGTSPGSGASGDPSPITAYGIYKGMKATAKEAFGDDSLKNKTIAVQGVGNVAFKLCRYLKEEGAQIIVTDINEKAVEHAVKTYGAKAVQPDEIYEVECDIFSPCALGAIINDDTIDKIKAKAIAGSANNQLESAKHGELLYEKGIVYAPDYVINSGGVINVSEELKGYRKENALKKVELIYDHLLRVYEISRKEQIPTNIAADRMAEERIASAKKAL